MEVKETYYYARKATKEILEVVVRTIIPSSIRILIIVIDKTQCVHVCEKQQLFNTKNEAEEYLKGGETNV